MEKPGEYIPHFLLFGMMFLFLIPTGCFLMPKEEKRLKPPLMKSPEVSYNEIVVKREDIIDQIQVTAYFQSAVERKLYFKYKGGHLKSFFCTLGDTVSKGDILAELEMDDLHRSIERQRLLVEKARIGYERLKVVDADKYQIRSAEIDIKLADLALQDLLATVESGTITSPISGIVVYRAGMEEGDLVDPYKTLIRIADPRRLVLVYSGSSSSSFKPGMPVKVRINNGVHEGKVLMTPVDVPPDTDTSLRNKVVFRLSRIPEEVERGDLALVSAILQMKKNVVVVPNENIHFYKGKPFVNVLKDEIKREQPVQTGIKTATKTEIVEGLHEGDRILW